jgi:hypothetical protein
LLLGVLLVLAAAAGYAGGLLGGTGRTEAPLPQTPSGDAELRNRVDELERRMENLQRRTEDTAETARAALDLAHSLREENRGGTLTPTGSGESPGSLPATPAAPLTPLSQDAADKQAWEDRMRQAEDIMRRNAPRMLELDLLLAADGSDGGRQDRAMRGAAEARTTAIHLGLGADVEMKLRDVFTAQWEQLHREAGPLLGEGLAKSDLESVQGALRRAWTETDRRVKEFCDEEQWKAYERLSGGARELASQVFEELRKKR